MTWEVRQISDDGGEVWGLYYDGKDKKCVKPLAVLQCDQNMSEKILLAMRFSDPDYAIIPGRDHVLVVNPPPRKKAGRKCAQRG